MGESLSATRKRSSLRPIISSACLRSLISRRIPCKRPSGNCFPATSPGEVSSILAPEPPLAPHGSASCKPTDLWYYARSVFGHNNVRNGELQNLLPRVSQHFSAGGVHVQVFSLCIGNENAVRRLFHQKAEMVFAHLERFLSSAPGFFEPHLLRHIALDAPGAHQLPILHNPAHAVAKYLGIAVDIHFVGLVIHQPES